MRKTVEKIKISFTIMLATILLMNGVVLEVDAANIIFYLDSSRNVISEDSVRLYTNLVKPYGARCTKAEIVIYNEGTEVKSYMEGFGAYNYFSTWTALDINYTVGSGCEVDYDLELGKRYEYQIRCWVDDQVYTTERGTFNMPGKVENVENWKGWSQTSDPRWSWKTLGDNPNALVRDYGCLVLCYAKVAVSAGVRSPENWTPAEFIDSLNANQAFYADGSLKNVTEVSKIIPEISYHKTITDMTAWCREVNELLTDKENHYEIILQTETIYGQHFMLIDRENLSDGIRLHNSWADTIANVSVPFTSVSTSNTPTKLIVLKVDVSDVDKKGDDAEQMMVHVLEETQVLEKPMHVLLSLLRNEQK